MNKSSCSSDYVPVIAIDGPTASGKGTVASRVAAYLGFHFLDSGVLYRLAALASIRYGIAPDEEDTLAKLIDNLNFTFYKGSVHLDGIEVTDEIRKEVVGNLSSEIAVHALVRSSLIARQRAFREPPGLVADGRDMGTIIFPKAILKVFLTASVKSRALRRYKQLVEKGFCDNFGSLILDLRNRDTRDRNRLIAPLKPAEDSKLLDTSSLSIDQSVEQVLSWYRCLASWP
ncbi:MAG: (d)CMP kinase [Burkholderia sp.]|nr:(d)CMP kinase [Burkholderia sp.]